MDESLCGGLTRSSCRFFRKPPFAARCARRVLCRVLLRLRQGMPARIATPQRADSVRFASMVQLGGKANSIAVSCAPLFIHDRHARFEMRDGVGVLPGVGVGVSDGFDCAGFGGAVFAVVLHDGKVDAAVALRFLQVHGEPFFDASRVCASLNELGD